MLSEVPSDYVEELKGEAMIRMFPKGQGPQKERRGRRWTWYERNLWLAALYHVATTDQPVDFDLYHFCGDWMSSVYLEG